MQENKDGQTDGKYIGNYTLEWRNPWCHKTLDIN